MSLQQPAGEDPSAEPASAEPAGAEHDSLLDGAAPAARADEEVDWKRVAAVCVAIVGAGVLLAAGLVATRPEAPRRPIAPSATGVRVSLAQEREIRPTVVGMGRVRPLRRVVISAQVAGTLAYVHPELEDGSFLDEGLLVVGIEPITHKAREQQQAALLDVAKAEVARLEVELAHIDSRLLVARELATLLDEDRARAEDLLSKKVGTDRELEATRQAALRSQDSLLALESTRAGMGPRLQAARARVLEAEARHILARVDVHNTRVKMPFAGQVAAVSVEQHQVVAPGTPLFEAWEIDRVEVPVALSLEEATLLAGDLGLNRERPDEAEQIRVEDPSGRGEGWTGVLRRFEPVDGATQTVKAVVEVENVSGRAPLLPDVFCRVSIQSAASRRGLTVPLHAVQERDRIYVVRDGKLAVATPRLGQRLGSWVLVEAGLDAGDQVVVSPIERPVEGIPLTVTEVVE